MFYNFIKILFFLIVSYSIQPCLHAKDNLETDKSLENDRANSHIRVLNKTEEAEIFKLALEEMIKLEGHLDNAVKTLESKSISMQICYTRVATSLKAYSDIINATQWNKHYLLKKHKNESEDSIFPLYTLDRKSLGIGIDTLKFTNNGESIYSFNKLTKAQQVIEKDISELKQFILNIKTDSCSLKHDRGE